LVETPDRRSANPYSVIIGHLLGVVSGYISLSVTGAWLASQVSPSFVAPQRVAAACFAAAFTVFLTLLLRASQPAALSTTLLIALGTMQKPKDALVIMAAVLLITMVGEPLHRIRLRDFQSRSAVFED
jgi:CBS domain-containing membrane protein